MFEVLKMRRLSIPENLISLHVHLKTNVETQFGPLTCMRLTGEPGTYDDNTDYNLAVLNLQYDLCKTPTLVSGDDSYLSGTLSPRSNWPFIKELLHLRFKTEQSDHGLFCGYYLGPQGCIRNPLALFAKLMIAEDDGSAFDKLPSYLTEFSIGHGLGDSLWQLLPSDLVLYQSACFDYFCRKATRSQKILLQPGLVDQETLDKIALSAKFISRPFYSMLSSHARNLISTKFKLDSSLTTLQDPMVEFELLPFSNVQ